jgi:hypothetical protein
VQPDSIRFNFKTQKALIWNSRSDQGEFKIKLQLQKKKMILFIFKGADLPLQKY